MKLASIVERTKLIDPSGRLAEQVIEHRTDPLTGTVASINTALGEKARAFVGSADLELLRELQEESRTACPFCSAAEKGTRFPPEFVKEGQIRVGSSLAMPNLFSKCTFDSVVIIDHARHVLLPSQIPSESFASAVRASAELVRRARAHDPAQVHHVAGMNFLQPAGSSVPHPHFQVQIRSVPYSGVSRLLRRSAAYRESSGRDYWSELVEVEKAAGARYLGRTGAVEWLAAFAPGHQREIVGLLPGVGSLSEIDDGGAAAFGAGIQKVAAFYEESGTHPFNFAFFSAPEPGGGRSFALQVRMCSRPALRRLFSNYDTWFTPKLIGDDVHLEAPESWAARLRARW